MNRLPRQPKPQGAKRKKRSARVEFAGGAKFYATANEFWGWVKRGFVRHVGDNPLVGEVANETELMNAKKHFKRKKGFS